MNRNTLLLCMAGGAAVLSAVGILIYFLLTEKPNQNKIIADLSEWNRDDLPLLLQELPENVTASVVPNFEQNSWFKLVHEGEGIISIPIFEVPLQDIDNCQLHYNAVVKTSEVQEQIYVELLCFLHGTSYFSRGLNQSLRGTVGETELSTPFFLKKGEYPEKVQLGIRIEGPGTVWVRDVQLRRQNTGILSSTIAVIHPGWLGAFVGIMGGLYGCTAGFCIPKGKAKWFVNFLGCFMIFFCSVSLLFGLTAILTGVYYTNWYPLVHTGILGLVIFIPIHIISMKNYQKFELQRMKAMDAMDSIS